MKRGFLLNFSFSAIGAIALSSSVQYVQAQTVPSTSTLGNTGLPAEMFTSQLPSLGNPAAQPLTPQSFPVNAPLTPIKTTGSTVKPEATGTIPVPAATPTPTLLFDENYPLGAGDVVQIQFFNVPEYNGEFQISPDGKLNLPLIGRVSLQGLTVDGAGDRLSRAYAKELRFPQVTVTLLRRRPLQVVMKGEIGNPGLYIFPSDSGGQPPRIFQAIQTAGGITQAGDLENVQIVRNSADPTLDHNLTVNLLALLQYGDLSQNVDLRDGDLISVPAAEVINVDNLQSLELSNLKSKSSEPVDVSLIGEVSIPGPYRFDTATTLITAIQKAGGLSPFADIQNISVERRGRDGSKRSINVDLWAILETGDRHQDVLLQVGDIVKIPSAELTNEQISAIGSSTLASGPIEVAILGEVKAPGTKQLKANTSLNQAILAAGGLNSFAKKDVKLLRFNPDGTVSERNIRLDPNQTINPEDNPILKSNDIIMVGISTWGSIKQTLSNLSSNLNFFLPYLFFLNK